VKGLKERIKGQSGAAKAQGIGEKEGTITALIFFF
jgi:hypothetical protein